MIIQTKKQPVYSTIKPYTSLTGLCLILTLIGPFGRGEPQQSVSPASGVPPTRSLQDQVVRPGTYFEMIGINKPDPMRVLVSLPDPQKGRYCGVRFASLPMVARVEWNGHVFFGEWNRVDSDPLSHDTNVLGTAEEFDIDGPTSFATASTNGLFLKIGVGMLRKPDDNAPYQFFRNYVLVQPAETRIRRGKRFVEALQTLVADEKTQGYGYEYRHTIALDSQKPRFRIVRTLTNTGTQILETEQYVHNFLSIDDDPIGPLYQFTTGVALQATDPLVLKKNGVEWEETRGTFSQPILASAPAFAVFKGPGLTTQSANRFTVSNLRTGAVMEIFGTRPTKGLSKIHLYATEHALCLEPFARLRIPHGYSVSWNDTYTFSEKK